MEMIVRCLNFSLPRIDSWRSLARRGILTEIREPPLDSTVPERPCTVVLAQDDGIYKTSSISSWKSAFSTTLVDKHGLSCADWVLSPGIKDMDSALQEMGRDLSAIPSPILVARGPWMSWMAQFYLESLALAGLVLVDPLPLNEEKSMNTLEAYFRDFQEGSRSSRLFQEYSSHWCHWTLKLEAGAVPMLVLSTKPEWEWAAETTVHRHSTAASSVPLLCCHGETEEVPLSQIANWIDEDVL